jgi:hypothetical protein
MAHLRGEKPNAAWWPQPRHVLTLRHQDTKKMNAHMVPGLCGFVALCENEGNDAKQSQCVGRLAEKRRADCAKRSQIWERWRMQVGESQRHMRRQRQRCKTKPMVGGERAVGTAHPADFKQTPCGVTTNGADCAKQSQMWERWGIWVTGANAVWAGTLHDNRGERGRSPCYAKQSQSGLGWQRTNAQSREAKPIRGPAGQPRETKPNLGQMGDSGNIGDGPRVLCATGRAVSVWRRACSLRLDHRSGVVRDPPLPADRAVP